MDNGLIFPCPWWCVHAEAGDANHPNLCRRPFGGVVWGSVGSELVVGKRWGDAGG
jgi:hypothetical protein